ncbi:MAG: hypothetical protein HY521_03620 [Proteobacteria bacterium]|nr:hypothetical protein [Pseudomonadota bacterium]
MSPADEARRLLDQAGAQVDKARGLIEQGEGVDLAPMEARITELCAAIAALGEAEARALRPALVGLLDEVTRLGEELKRRHRDLGTELQGLAERTRAATAYGRRGGKS